MGFPMELKRKMEKFGEKKVKLSESRSHTLVNDQKPITVFKIGLGTKDRVNKTSLAIISPDISSFGHIGDTFV